MKSSRFNTLKRIEPFIPFKVNSRGHSKGSPMWNRKFHEFLLHLDDFDQAYHQRSNVEATFSAIKRKLGESLISRTELARMNELLAKILAYNIAVVIAQSTKLGLERGPLAFIPIVPRRPDPVGVAA